MHAVYTCTHKYMPERLGKAAFASIVSFTYFYILLWLQVYARRHNIAAWLLEGLWWWTCPEEGDQAASQGQQLWQQPWRQQRYVWVFFFQANCAVLSDHMLSILLSPLRPNWDRTAWLDCFQIWDVSGIVCYINLNVISTCNIYRHVVATLVTSVEAALSRESIAWEAYCDTVVAMCAAVYASESVLLNMWQHQNAGV